MECTGDGYRGQFALLGAETIGFRLIQVHNAGQLKIFVGVGHDG